MFDGTKAEAPQGPARTEQDTPELTHVFISYASVDKQIADDLCAVLERSGIACWIAPRDVSPGALYAEAIVRAIASAKALVLVLSEHAIASTHVGREVERAISKRRRIIALRMDAAPLDSSARVFLERISMDRSFRNQSRHGLRQAGPMRF